MGRKVKKTIIEVPEWEEEPEKAEVIDQEDQEMESIARSLPGGVRCINLYRMHRGGMGGRPKFIAQLPPEQFSEAFIQESYGGGSYFARWQKKDGSTLKYTFDIEGPEKILTEEAPPDEPTFIPTTAPDDRGLSTYDVLRLIQDARKEAREEMRSLVELLRPPAPPPDATQQVFSLVERIVPLVAQGGGGDSNPWLFALSQFKEPIAKLVETVNHAVTHARPAAPVTPATPPTPAARPAVAVADGPSTTGNDEMIVKLMLKQALPLLINGATKNADPELYGEMILDQVPSSAYNALREWLARPDCLEQIASIEPGVKFQADWWQALRAWLLDELSEHVVSVQSDANQHPTTGGAPAGGESA